MRGILYYLQASLICFFMSKRMTKYIFVTGGVMSGVGKGVASASMGRVLKSKGFKVSAVKIDPYVNIDAGTMNPTEHGEVFVTEDGDETDQDLGNYERFLEENIYSGNYMTTGRVYLSVIEKERNLEFGGRCVEVVPHIPEEVILRIRSAAENTNSDFVIVEIGGTVGEYQNILFLEAARMMKLQEPENVLFMLVSYLPVPNKIGEMKTKPTQYAVRTLNSAGIQPDFLICRSEYDLDTPRIEKISKSCNVSLDCVISAKDIDSIYEIPLNFEKQHLGELILKKFGVKNRPSDLSKWKKMVDHIKKPKDNVKIGIVGKYFGSGNFNLSDSYISVIEALKHASWDKRLHAEIDWIDAHRLEKDPEYLKSLKNYDGILVPGGFGKRGIVGKLLAIEYARKNKIPYLGICYGMQLAAIEFARNVLDLQDANSTEINEKTKNPIVYIIPNKEFEENKKYGGTMRLGAYDCKLSKSSTAFSAYKEEFISERHRHRYEFNNDYKEMFSEKGLLAVGVSPLHDLVEVLELKDHPFFVGVQFHPEFKSRPLTPHPLFKKFIATAYKLKK